MMKSRIVNFYCLIVFGLFFNTSCQLNSKEGSSKIIDTGLKSDNRHIENESNDTVFSTADLIGKGNPVLTAGKGYKLLPEVAKQFELMKAEAKKAGFTIHVVSSYRNFVYQNGIWERKYKANQAQKINPKQNIEKIIEYSTIPGTSRHHWGTDLDIIDATNGIPGNPLNEKYFNKGGSMHKFKQWMDDNASKFGFYLVYTDNPARKGFKYEPWHYTYKAISKPMLNAYKKIDLKKILQENKLTGSENFTDEFIKKYREENVLDINPEIK